MRKGTRKGCSLFLYCMYKNGIMDWFVLRHQFIIFIVQDGSLNEAFIQKENIH